MLSSRLLAPLKGSVVLLKMPVATIVESSPIGIYGSVALQLLASDGLL